MELDGSEPRLGSAAAPFQILEFADFECPHCGQVAPQLKQIVKENSDTNLRFKQYPLSNICNPNIGHEFHANACTASAATECAHLQGKFWELSAQLFKNQKFLTRSDINFQAERLSLDMSAFASCMDDSAQHKRVGVECCASKEERWLMAHVHRLSRLEPQDEEPGQLHASADR